MLICLLTPETPDDPLDIDSSESEYGLLANMLMIYFLFGFNDVVISLSVY